MRAIVVCAVVAALWMGSLPVAGACTCPRMTSKIWKKSKRAAVAIFSAKILSRVIDKKKARMIYKVRVLRYWKGKLRKHIVVRESWGPCSNYMQVGTRYLIFAKHTKYIKGLSTQMCTGTGRLHAMRKWLKRLGKGKRAK